MAKTTFLNTPSDCRWLLDTHLNVKNLGDGQKVPDFNSFCIYGNEDFPDKIELFPKQDPEYNNVGTFFILRSDDKYYLKS